MSLSQQIIPAGDNSNVQIYPPKIAMQLAALQIFVTGLRPEKPCKLFNWDESKLILLEATEAQRPQTHTIIKQKGLGISVAEAVVAVVETLRKSDVAKWLQYYVHRLSKLQKAQDKVSEALCDFTEKTFPGTTINLYADGADCNKIKDYFSEVLKRRRPAHERKQAELAKIAESWGPSWEQAVTLDGTLEIRLSLASLVFIRKAAQHPIGNARLFGQLLDDAMKERVESRELNLGGGGSKTRAVRQDFERAWEKFQTVRQSELASPALLNQGSRLILETSPIPNNPVSSPSVPDADELSVANEIVPPTKAVPITKHHKPRQRDSHPEEVPNDGSNMREATKPQLRLLPPTSFKPTSSDKPDYESSPSKGRKVIVQSVQYEDEPSVANKIVQPTKAFPITKPRKRRQQRDSHPEEAPEDGDAPGVVQETPEDGRRMKEATTLQLPSPLKPTSSDTPDYPEQAPKDGRHIKEAMKSQLPMLPPAVPNTKVIAPKLRCLSLTQSGSLLNAIKAGTTLGDSEYPIANICNMRQCLNDEPIDCYSRLVEASENRRRGIRTVVQMGSFWYTKHLGNYTKDKDWPNKWYQKRAKGDENTIQQFHFVLNLGGDHWALAVLHPKLKELRVYDTLPRDKKKVEQQLRGMLSRVKSWEGLGKVEVIWVPVSKQKGLTECGVFVCEMMRLTARADSVELETTTENINRLRHIIAFELLQRRLLEDPHDISTPLFTGSPNRIRNRKKNQLEELKSEDAWLRNQDQQRNDMAPKGKEAEEGLGEVALTEIDELGHGGEAEEEREKEAHTETAASNTQAMESKDLQLEDTILENTGLEKPNQQKEEEVLIPETQDDAKHPAFEHSSTIGASLINDPQFTPSKIKRKISTRKSPRSIFQKAAAGSSTPSRSNFGLAAGVGARPDEIVKARQLKKFPRPDNFPIADDLEFENALYEIIGKTKLEAIQNGETVEVPLLWLPLDTAFGSTSFLVKLQLAMYMDLAPSSGVITHCVHSALQLAVRQDILLWMLATWLWKDHEVISLPVPPSSSEVEFLLPPSGFVATVQRDSITIPWCDLHWQPLYMISKAECSLISKANRERGAVEHKHGKYEAVAFFSDGVASLFQHPNTVSMALMGAMSWQDPFVVRKMNELANPARIAAVVREFSSLMSSLICGSAKESLILDSDLRGDKSLLAQKGISVELLNDSFRLRQLCPLPCDIPKTEELDLTISNRANDPSYKPFKRQRLIGNPVNEPSYRRLFPQLDSSVSPSPPSRLYGTMQDQIPPSSFEVEPEPLSSLWSAPGQGENFKENQFQLESLSEGSENVLDSNHGAENCEELGSDQDTENPKDLTRTSPIRTSPVIPAKRPRRNSDTKVENKQRRKG